METKITKEFLREHFRKHDTLTLYRADGTPVTFTRQHKYVVAGGCHKFTFDTCEGLAEFYLKQGLSMTPKIDI